MTLFHVEVVSIVAELVLNKKNRVTSFGILWFSECFSVFLFRRFFLPRKYFIEAIRTVSRALRSFRLVPSFCNSVLRFQDFLFPCYGIGHINSRIFFLLDNFHPDFICSFEDIALQSPSVAYIKTTNCCRNLFDLYLLSQFPISCIEICWDISTSSQWLDSLYSPFSIDYNVVKNLEAWRQERRTTQSLGMSFWFSAQFYYCPKLLVTFLLVLIDFTSNVGMLLDIPIDYIKIQGSCWNLLLQSRKVLPVGQYLQSKFLYQTESPQLIIIM